MLWGGGYLLWGGYLLCGCGCWGDTCCVYVCELCVDVVCACCDVCVVFVLALLSACFLHAPPPTHTNTHFCVHTAACTTIFPTPHISNPHPPSSPHRLIWLVIALNVTYAIALSGLMLFYRGTHELLQPYKPLLKFVLIKAVVFLTFWQVWGWGTLVQNTHPTTHPHGTLCTHTHTHQIIPLHTHTITHNQSSPCITPPPPIIRGWHWQY